MVNAHPLTAAQRELWLGLELDAGAAASAVFGHCMVLKGTLDAGRFQQAIAAALERHPSLCGHFSDDGSQWLDGQPPPCPLIDLRSGGDSNAQIATLMAQPFLLTQGPLLRMALLRLADNEHHWLRVWHEAASDETSEAQWLRAVAAFYRNDAPDLPAPLSARDYVAKEQAFEASPRFADAVRYWQTLLDGVPNQLVLPHDRPRPAQRSYATRETALPLSPTLSRALGADDDAAVWLLAASAGWMARLGSSHDLVLGLDVSGQHAHSAPGYLGQAANLLPVRVQPQMAQTFAGLLQAVRAQVADSRAQAGLHFSRLLPTLTFARDPGRPPLVPVLVRGLPPASPDFGPLQVQEAPLPRSADRFELTLELRRDATTGALQLAARASRVLFGSAMLHLRLTELVQFLETAHAAPDTPLAALPLRTAASDAAWAALNASEGALPSLTVFQQIAARAAAQPAALALHCGATTLDYAALMRRASTIAAALLAAGVQSGDCVGVCLERGPELPAALLAVWQAGAAYLPLDPEFPAERLHYTLDDAGAALVIADDGSAGKLTGNTCHVMRLDGIDPESRADARAVPPESPAYVIYTSGSTGRPKGVVIPHRALGNFLAGMTGMPGIAAGDVLLAVTTVSFDIAALELWLPLASGAAIVLADRATAVDGQALIDCIRQHRVNRMQATPATWRLLLGAGWTGDREHFVAMTGGEPLPRDLARQLLPRVRQLWNLYGPTETTVWSTAQRIDDADAPILIGRPILNTQCWVLDEQRELQPLGATGRLWIGGAGLALGYHQRPELTAEKFVQHPRCGHLYDTGDLARLTTDGLECLGRADFQIKLRGYRIEPGEIEFALTRHPAVAEASVQVNARSPGDDRLVAYVVTKPGEDVSASDLRAAVRGFLPAYMLPQEYRLLAALPRLPNGKLDRQALPDPFAGQQAAAPRTPPATEAERQLAALWAEALGLPNTGRISREDRFFDLGGHSLLAMQLAGRMAALTGRRPHIQPLMMDPLALLAREWWPDAPVAESASAAATAATEVPAKSWLARWIRR
jgi:amino acid adenylation domain-containing protein